MIQKINIRHKPAGQLCFYFDARSPQQPCWEYRAARGEVSRGQSPDAIPALKHDPVWLAVPTTDCLFYTVSGGKMSPEALRWQLEGLALGDIDALHITRLASAEGQHHLVAVDAVRLRHYLDLINRCGYRPQYAVPEVLLLPPESSAYLGGRWLARSSGQAGVAVTESDREHLCQHAPHLAALTDVNAAGWLTLSAGKNRIPSLLHGSFSAEVNRRTSLRCLAAALVVSLLALPAVPLWQGWQLNRTAQQVSDRSQQLYQHYFPGLQTSSPTREFRQRLLQLETAAAPAGMLALLDKSAALLDKLNETPLKTLEWDADRQLLHLHFAATLPASQLSPLPPDIVLTQQDNQRITLGWKP